VAAGEVEPLEATALVLDAPDHIRIAVVTSGNRQGATAIVAAIGLKERGSFIISGDDVTHGKPDPEPYARAAEQFGIAPARCLVLEDHPDGIASAKAAGMTVIDVTESTTMAAAR
jgi:mannitol-1-/sugar-/sorbitol-6-phosphatase